MCIANSNLHGQTDRIRRHDFPRAIAISIAIAEARGGHGGGGGGGGGLVAAAVAVLSAAAVAAVLSVVAVARADFPASGDFPAAGLFRAADFRADPDRQCCALPAFRARSRALAHPGDFLLHADGARAVTGGSPASPQPGSTAIWSPDPCEASAALRFFATALSLRPGREGIRRSRAAVSRAGLPTRIGTRTADGGGATTTRSLRSAGPARCSGLMRIGIFLTTRSGLLRRVLALRL